ncbi:unnamed protein product [Rotaria sp. Silwood1]|nr:unnamed protein product [Rotaria sp. Silwood1]
MTFPAYHSIELNAHMLTIISLLVLNEKLPIESLNIFLFSSQPCENIFRSARALTGPFSTMTNFTVQQFLSKTRKISILNEIKCFEESNVTSGGIKFPKHHKQNQSNAFSSILINLNELTLDNIEKNIYDAYEYAKSFAEKLGMSSLLKTKNVFQLNDLSLNIRNDLEKIIYLNDDSTLDNDDNSDSGDEENYYSLASDVEDDNENEESETENECTQSTKDVFNGMRIYSTVADKDKNKFFKIEINNKIKYIHKQTAVWYLTNNNNRLSSDRLVRLVRVQKASRQ